MTTKRYRYADNVGPRWNDVKKYTVTVGWFRGSDYGQGIDKFCFEPGVAITWLKCDCLLSKSKQGYAVDSVEVRGNGFSRDVLVQSEEGEPLGLFRLALMIRIALKRKYNKHITTFPVDRMEFRNE